MYLESYTSILMISKEKLVRSLRRVPAVPCQPLLTQVQEAFYERPVITATREMVELESDEMIRNADQVDVAFLVVGDPLGSV